MVISSHILNHIQIIILLNRSFVNILSTSILPNHSPISVALSEKNCTELGIILEPILNVNSPKFLNRYDVIGIELESKTPQITVTDLSQVDSVTKIIHFGSDSCYGTDAGANSRGSRHNLAGRGVLKVPTSKYAVKKLVPGRRWQLSDKFTWYKAFNNPANHSIDDHYEDSHRSNGIVRHGPQLAEDEGTSLDAGFVEADFYHNRHPQHRNPLADIYSIEKDHVDTLVFQASAKR